ncbi:M23 family metallopeptidase [Paenibacillus sp. IITD108]|uniref:M23 family metallopeptidase n=1 Tax=Paenibacillus sp. IITD108 TaxID=3116649 RepID=UPI002F40CE21
MIDKVKSYAKNKIKKELIKIAFKLLKKLLAKAIALIGKLLLAIAGLLGVKGILIIIVIILVGGMVMYIMPFFGWFFSGSKSPKTPEELTQEYVVAYESTSSYDEYRSPQLLMQFIDNIKILKDNKDLWEVNPKKIAKHLKADITTTKFKTKETTTRETIIKTEDKKTETSVSTSVNEKDIDLITSVHAWNRIEEITYNQKSTSYSYTTTDTEGNEVNVTVETVEWVEASCSSTSDYTKFDELLMDLKFGSSEFDLLIQTIIANNEEFLDGYDGTYGMYYGDDTSWWEDDSGAPINGDWKWPTVSTRITSSYYVRIHPVTKEKSMHTGIDIGRPIVNGKFDERAQPIFSVADGKVTHAGSKGTYGTAVYVDHGNGLVTIYAHLKSVDKNIKVGSIVEPGTVLGIMGSTGRSTGIHLHFSVMVNGKYDNPLKFIKPPG